MGWVEPAYSRSRVDAAGVTYVDPTATPEERELALSVINNWRSSHAFPLNTIQMNLRRKVNQLQGDSLVAQRIKRLPSVTSKLERFPGMKLSRVQDIGGCRAVLPDVKVVDQLLNEYEKSRARHKLVRQDDYIRNPKSSGYRGVHLVHSYQSDEKETYKGLKIETQLRTRLQHTWATAVETVGTFTEQALKSSRGDAEWLRFFTLMSSEFAFREDTRLVPGTPENAEELRNELRDSARRLDVVNRLSVYGSALQVLEEGAAGQRRNQFFLLELDVAQNTLTVRTYRDSMQANEAYRAIETAISGAPDKDAVLVSVESFNSLKRAYPNYFLDTSAFLDAVRGAIGA